METAISGFKKTGIYPFQRIFGASSFAAVETTNREATAGTSQDQRTCAVQEKPQTPSNVIPEGSIIVSPQDILPIPRVFNQGDGAPKRKRSHGSTVVATSTPFMEELKISKQRKEPAAKKKKKILKKQLFPENDNDSESSEIDPPLDDESSFELDDQTSPTGPTGKCCTITDLEEGSWVAVNYEGNLFPGLVINRANTEVTVKCMEKCQKYFRWPNKEDIMTYGEEDIYMVIKKPKVLRRGFFDVPELGTYATP